MIVDDKFNVVFSAKKCCDGPEWFVSVRLFPDPMTLKSHAECLDKLNKESKQLKAITLESKGRTQAEAFANALRAAADYVVECEKKGVT